MIDLKIIVEKNGYIPITTLQGNNGRIDKNMSESSRDKLQKIVRKLSKVTDCWQKCPNW